MDRAASKSNLLRDLVSHTILGVKTLGGERGRGFQLIEVRSDRVRDPRCFTLELVSLLGFFAAFTAEDVAGRVDVADGFPVQIYTQDICALPL